MRSQRCYVCVRFTAPDLQRVTDALTLFSQQERVESHVIGGQVDPALTRHSAFPAAAGVMSHQLFFQREAEPLLESHHRLAETRRVVVQRRLAHQDFLSD